MSKGALPPQHRFAPATPGRPGARTVARLLAALMLSVCVGPVAASEWRDDLLRKLNERNFAALDAELGDLQARYEAGTLGEEHVHRRFMAFSHPEARTELVDAWVSERPRSYPAHLAAAVRYRALGWWARGTDYASLTVAARFRDADRLFGQAMAHAEESLKLAAKPTISHVLMVDIARPFRARDMPVLHYVQRGLALEPRSVLIRSTYLSALQPKWGGSLGEMEEVLQQARKAGLDEEALRRLESRTLQFMGESYEETDPPQALELLDRALALHEEASAQKLRGRILASTGRLQEGRRALERAVALDPDDKSAQRSAGDWHWVHGDKAVAAEYFRRSGALGDTQSAHFSGCLLDDLAPSGKPDPVAALPWYKLGASLGHDGSMFAVAECYREGACGEKPDYAKAAFWHGKASEYGNHVSSLVLGGMYWTGEGVARDVDRAAGLWAGAARSTDAEERRYAYRDIVLRLDPPRMIEALARASGHFPLALAMLAVMLLVPLATLLIALRDGAMKSGHEAAGLVRPLVLVPPVLFWLRAGGLPLATGAAFWAAFALGLFAEFIWVFGALALVAWPSLGSLYRLAVGDFRILLDDRALDFRDGAERHEVLWQDLVFIRLDHAVVRFGTRAGRYGELKVKPFGIRLWNEIAKRAPAHALEPDAESRMPPQA